MKLELSQSLQQQQILAPQMILSMDILLLPSLDLEQRIRKDFAENPALEIQEKEQRPTDAPTPPPVEAPSASSESFAKLEPYQYSFDPPKRKGVSQGTDSKHEALQNTEGKPPGLKDFLTQQVHLGQVGGRVQSIAEDIINNLDGKGYLLFPAEELRDSFSTSASAQEIDEAIGVVRSLDPAGVGAEDLQDCLLLQLERDRQEYPLEQAIIRNHLTDLRLNKLPKIAKDLGRSVEDIKDAVEIISLLDPIPGGRLESEPTIYVRADVIVEVIDGEVLIRVENGNIPELKVSETCRSILKASRGNREITDFVRKKIESAQWLIQAVQQRKRTLYDIAVTMAKFQRNFMIHGPEKLKAMKMQTIADLVKMHISTISRAIKGKYMQTPHGLYQMRYFFTGGVDNASGEVESRRNVYRRIGEIIEAEDKKHPHSDSQIARILQDQGLKIARRTVTKYREQEGIPSSRLRKSY